MYVYSGVCVYVYLYSVYVCVLACVCVCVHRHVCVWVCPCVFVRRRVCVSVYVCVCAQCVLQRSQWSCVSLRWMYWTDWEEDPSESKRGKIERAWMDGSNRNVFLTSKTILWPNGLSLDIPQGILYWVDAYYDRIEMVYINSTERKVPFSKPAAIVLFFFNLISL